jgi:hypothetical protein
MAATATPATLDDVLAVLAYQASRIDNLQTQIAALRKENDDLRAAAALSPKAAEAAEQAKIDKAVNAAKENTAKIDALKV